MKQDKMDSFTTQALDIILSDKRRYQLTNRDFEAIEAIYNALRDEKFDKETVEKMVEKEIKKRGTRNVLLKSLLTQTESSEPQGKDLRNMANDLRQAMQLEDVEPMGDFVPEAVDLYHDGSMAINQVSGVNDANTHSAVSSTLIISALIILGIFAIRAMNYV